MIYYEIIIIFDLLFEIRDLCKKVVVLFNVSIYQPLKMAFPYCSKTLYQADLISGKSSLLKLSISFTQY